MWLVGAAEGCGNPVEGPKTEWAADQYEAKGEAGLLRGWSYLPLRQESGPRWGRSST